MKVKCIKFLSPLGDGMELDSCDYMTIGKEYIVLGISLKKNKQSLYLECDTGQPGYLDENDPSEWPHYDPLKWLRL